MEIKEMKIVEPEYGKYNFDQARQQEGYKTYRPHASGILIHAVRNGSH